MKNNKKVASEFLRLAMQIKEDALANKARPPPLKNCARVNIDSKGRRVM